MDRLWLYGAVALGLWVVLLIYQTLTSPLRTIPGPFYTLFSYLPLKLSIITGTRIHFIHALHQKHGRIVRISPSEISLSSLTEFKEIHRPGSGYLKTKWYEKILMGAPPGVFAMSDIREHAARRKLLAGTFGKSELRGTLEGVVRGKVRLAVQKMKVEMGRDTDGQREAGRCDVLKWWMFLATDVAGHLIFGEDFGMVELGVKNEYIHFLESIMKGSGIYAELPLAGFIARHIPIASLRAIFRASDYLASYRRRVVRNARMTSKSRRNIVSGMIHASENSDTGLSELGIVAEAGNLIVAGSDTTAITLTYLVYAVLSQPQLQAELEDEVLGLKEGYNDAILETLPLLNAVIKESLRLYGAASGSLPRDIPERGAMLAGHYIPEGFTVSTQSYTIHRDPEIYPNPEVFDVSRWLGESRKSNSTGQLAFFPFGTGSRICLGIHLAYMELRLAAAEFFRECRGVKLAPSVTKESMGFENYFLIAPRGHMCEVVNG